MKLDELVGSKLAGRYRVVASLARGGMGAVFEAEDEQLHRRVAVKVVRSEFLLDPVSLARFRREALAMAQVKHPSLVTIYDVSLESEPMFFVLELLDGPTLESLLAQGGGVHWTRAVQIAVDVLEALQVLHNAGIVHRDIKPSNLVLVREGDRERIKVIDLGVAKLTLDPEPSPLTWTGTIVGTPSYMAPEQLAGEPVNEAADLYSLGVVLTKLLLGKDHPPLTDILDGVEIHGWPATAPTELRVILQTLLAHNPLSRPHSARSAAALLAQCLAPAEIEQPQDLESSYGAYAAHDSTPKAVASHTRTIAHVEVASNASAQTAAERPIQAVNKSNVVSRTHVRSRAFGAVLLLVIVTLVAGLMGQVALVRYRQHNAQARPISVPRLTQAPEQPSLRGLYSDLSFYYGGQNKAETERDVAPQIEPGLRRCMDFSHHTVGQQVVAVDVYVTPLGNILRIEWHPSRADDRGSTSEVACIEGVLRGARWTPYTGSYSTSVIALLM